MAFFCEYIVHITISATVWRKLCTRGHEDAVLQRLGNSRAFSIHGVLPTSTPTPQRHVSVVVFLSALGRTVYDRLLSTRHSFVSLESSYIDSVCDSDMWCIVFGPILQHCIVQHYPQYIRLEITGYEILRRYIFYAWTDFPFRYLAEATDVDPHPPLVRVDPTMFFMFFGMSACAPHVQVGFTCDRYVWNHVLHRYKSLGAVQRHFTP